MASIPSSLGEAVIPQSSGNIVRLDRSGLDQAAITKARLSGAGAEAIAGGLDKVAAAFNVLQEQDDKRNAKDLINQYTKDLLTIGYGDGSKENPGYYSSQGQGALDQKATTEGRIKAARDALLGKAINKRSRDMFDIASSTIQNSEMEQISKHAAAGREDANKATSLATITTANSRAAANWNNPEVTQQSLFISQNEAKAMAKHQGITDPVAVQSMVDAAATDVLSGVIKAAAANDPAQARKLYVQYKDQIDGNEQYKLEATISEQERAAQSQAEHNMLMTEHYKDEASKAALNDVVSGIIGGNPPSFQSIANDTRMDASAKITAYNMLKASDKGEPMSDVSSRTASELYRRINLPDSDPEKIVDRKVIGQAFADHLLSKADFNFVNTQFDNASNTDTQKLTQTVSQFTTGFQHTISKSVFGQQADALGDQKFYEFQQYVSKKVDEARKAHKDPAELFNPASKEYLGNPGTISMFKPTMQDNINYMMKNLQTSTVSTTGQQEFSSIEELQAAVKVNLITRDEAYSYAKTKGWTLKTDTAAPTGAN